MILISFFPYSVNLGALGFGKAKGFKMANDESTYRQSLKQLVMLFLSPET